MLEVSSWWWWLHAYAWGFPNEVRQGQEGYGLWGALRSVVRGIQAPRLFSLWCVYCVLVAW